MKRLMFLFNGKTLTILATATAVAVIGGSPVSAAPNGGALASGAVQAKPGGIVVNATGGYYDPARSTYVVAPVRSAGSTGGHRQGADRWLLRPGTQHLRSLERRDEADECRALSSRFRLGRRVRRRRRHRSDSPRGRRGGSHHPAPQPRRLTRQHERAGVPSRPARARARVSGCGGTRSRRPEGG